MASESIDLNENIENLKVTVRKSFARIYAALKARELKTLRQLDALRKQCEDDKTTWNCVQNIEIKYDNESTLLENVSNYGVIDLEKLNFDSNTFTLEDYVSPNDDHMYCYKTIEDLTKEDDNKEIEAIEEAALKEITSADNCVCYVNIHAQDISKKFRYSDAMEKVCVHDKSVNEEVDNVVPCTEKIKDNSEDVKKIDPTDDWLNSIKSQTETEPSQVTDVMEHSNINGT